MRQRARILSSNLCRAFSAAVHATGCTAFSSARLFTLQRAWICRWCGCTRCRALAHATGRTVFCSARLSTRPVERIRAPSAKSFGGTPSRRASARAPHATIAQKLRRGSSSSKFDQARAEGRPAEKVTLTKQAGVAKLADAQDLKSWDSKESWGFDSHPPHHDSARRTGLSFISGTIRSGRPERGAGTQCATDVRRRR